MQIRTAQHSTSRATFALFPDAVDMGKEWETRDETTKFFGRITSA